MELLYAAADVAVCRAGAMTVAELAVAGVPSVLVPLPGAPGDHQGANARVLAEAGGAVMVRDAACTGAALAEELDRLFADPAALPEMERAVHSLGRPEAAGAAAAPGRTVRSSSARFGAPMSADRSGAPWDPSVPSAVHVVGIGGAGMSAIATVLSSMGHVVTGSDLRESAVTERLSALGIPVSIGHEAANVGVGRGGHRLDRGRPLQPGGGRSAPATGAGSSRAAVLAAIASLRRCIAIAGTHGKTTTASMLALVARRSGHAPLVPDRW